MNLRYYNEYKHLILLCSKTKLSHKKSCTVLLETLPTVLLAAAQSFHSFT